RDALAQIRDLTLSPDKFPPKVIDAFEKAREEARSSAPAAPRPTSTPARAAAGSGGGGGGKTVLIIGGLAAVGGGVALAAGGGKGSRATGTPTPTPDSRKRDVFGPVDLFELNYEQDYAIVVAASGTLAATLNWTSRGGSKEAVLAM